MSEQHSGWQPREHRGGVDMSVDATSGRFAFTQGIAESPVTGGTAGVLPSTGDALRRLVAVRLLELECVRASLDDELGRLRRLQSRRIT